MSEYSEFFLASKSSVIQFELLELSHPNFTKTYYIVRNSTEGLTVKLETGQIQNFEYYPMEIKLGTSTDDLDQSITFNLGDLGEILPKELDSIRTGSGFGIKPQVKYRTYRSDNLDLPMVGPILLEVDTFSFNIDGVSFEAKAPSLNINKTGELYKIDRFPMLRGFL